MHNFIQNDWWNILLPQFKMPYYQKLRHFLVSEYSTQYIHPAPNRVFEAFKMTPFSKVKVVILGQDPYPEPHYAMGLSFSVLPGNPIPRSLQNIYKEMYSDIGARPVNHGCLVSWTQQGVMLLNSILTVRNGKPLSHKNKGWEQLTDYAIQKLSQRKQPVIFILWGRKAQAKEQLIDTSHNIIIASPHPSPFSASHGFFGSRPFSKANYALKQLHEKPINWQLPENITLDDLKKVLK